MGKSKNATYVPDTGLTIIVGNFGSGKTEISVNLALYFKSLVKDVQIADLDIVNPYFRCREAKDIMEEKGIRVVVPVDKFHWADLPIVLPEIRGMLDQKDAAVIFDVGGDDLGARLLSTFSSVISNRPYEMLQVVNERRPFTETADGVEKIMREIEEASRLEVTGLVSNAHLMNETTTEIILRGLDLCRRVGDRTKKAVEFATAPRRMEGENALVESGASFLWLDRHMLPPHLQNERHSWEKRGRNRAPADGPLWGPSREG